LSEISGKWDDFWDKDWQEFFIQEQISGDSIDVKRIYLKMAGDIVAGVLLSQIVFWCLPTKEWRSKLRVYRDGCLWVAKSRTGWEEEDGIPITPRQVDRALKILRDAGLVETVIHRFRGAPTIHIRLTKKFLEEWHRMHKERVEKLGISPIR